ncbi:MAG: hypothetical protein JW862_13080 [Anaerolineales bacterium]|nr:hypothetical protein [Anaerolineales bacterium]
MSKALKFTFAVHAAVALLFGLPLLVVPGRFLGLFGWAPIDPLISRLLGAALIALAWSSYRGFRSTDSRLGTTLIQMELVFTLLGAIGLLRHLLVAWYPWYVWTLFYILAAFAIAWLYFLWKHR